MRLPDVEAWAIFASVAEYRSFTGAAEAIGLSKASVSKAITRLETQLATSLFHRTSRRLTLTESGRALAEYARRMLAEGRAAQEAALESASALAGPVRVSAPMSFGLLHVAPVLADFLAQNPAIHVDLTLSDAHIDIVAAGVDIALRIADLPDSSLRARRLGSVATHIVAAPAYLAAAGTPAHPAQLGEHRLLAYANVRGPWRFINARGTEAVVRAEGRLRANSGEALLPALRAGLGIAMLPDFIVADDLASGALVTLLDDWSVTPQVALHLMTPPGKLRPARVEALIGFFADRLTRICAA
ncbi:MAG: LysR family transcriptional regulator [Sphingomonas sp.]